MSRFFEGTCEVFDLKDCSVVEERTFYIDPCNCSTFYECSHTTLERRECAPGTWLDLENPTTCIHSQEKIFEYPCDTPWKRCDVSEERLIELEGFCTGTTPAPTRQTDNPSSPNIGLIIGLVLAAVALIVIILIVVCYIRKRKSSNSSVQKSRPSVQNPEYFGKNADDEYAIIDDSLHNPEYKKNITTMSRPNGTMPLPPIPTDNVEYDNSAFNNHGYSTTLQASVREYETPFSINNATNNAPGIHNGVRVNGMENSQSISVERKEVSSIQTVTPMGNHSNLSVIHVTMDVNGNRDKLNTGTSTQ